MLHLNAAFACAAQHYAEDTVTHLDEAAALADGLDDEVGAFANLRFGRTIVGMWRVSVATELGDGGRVAEAVSCAVWPGGWELPPAGEFGPGVHRFSGAGSGKGGWCGGDDVGRSASFDTELASAEPAGGSRVGRAVGLVLGPGGAR
jgi:hypothetical protein